MIESYADALEEAAQIAETRREAHEAAMSGWPDNSAPREALAQAAHEDMRIAAAIRRLITKTPAAAPVLPAADVPPEPGQTGVAAPAGSGAEPQITITRALYDHLMEVAHRDDEAEPQGASGDLRPGLERAREIWAEVHKSYVQDWSDDRVDRQYRSDADREFSQALSDEIVRLAAQKPQRDERGPKSIDAFSASVHEPRQRPAPDLGQAALLEPVCSVCGEVKTEHNQDNGNYRETPGSSAPAPDRAGVVSDAAFTAAQKEFNSAQGWGRSQPEKMRAALEAARPLLQPSAPQADVVAGLVEAINGLISAWEVMRDRKPGHPRMNVLNNFEAALRTAKEATYRAAQSGTADASGRGDERG